MSGALRAGSSAVLLTSPVLRTYGCALIGRLAYGVLPLCFLFTVSSASGSLATAGAAAAALGAGTLAMPLQSRLVDRHGQGSVLPVFWLAHASVVAAAVACAVTDVATTRVWLLLGFCAGVVGPALGPAMRAQWREIAAEGPPRRRAYSIDSVGEEAVFVVGPVVAAGTLAVAPAYVGLVVGSALLAVGIGGLVTSPFRPAPGIAAGVARQRSARPEGMLRLMLPLLATMLCFGMASAATFIGVAALADAAGRPALAGLLEAAVACGAVLGALLWARWGPGRPSWCWLALALLFVAAWQLAAAVGAASVVLVGAALAVGALAISPVFVTAFSLADGAVAPERRTEASTWVTVGGNAGHSLGTAVAAATVVVAPAGPFVAASGFALAAAVLASTRARHITGDLSNGG